MTPPVVGALLGLVGGSALVGLLARVRALRHTPLQVRVLPYLRDLTSVGVAGAAAVGSPDGSAPTLFRPALGPLLDRAADLIGKVLGGSASIRSRLERAGSGLTVHDFRLQQALWGAVGFSAVAVPATFLAAQAPARITALTICSGVAFMFGVLLRENRLTAEVGRRERRILEELPVIAELLALAVAAGETPMAALARIVERSRGEFSVDLRRVLAEANPGLPVSSAFDSLAARTGVAPVARFAAGIAIAIDRGSPLADVLHAQAGDVREAARRALIETGARREVLMMVPVVFLVLPVVVVFAFWPGLVGLRLVVP